MRVDRTTMVSNRQLQFSFQSIHSIKIIIVDLYDFETKSWKSDVQWSNDK